jgi:hypothetical protein
MISVPYGKLAERARAQKRLMRKRALAPSTAPRDIHRNVCTMEFSSLEFGRSHQPAEAGG